MSFRRWNLPALGAAVIFAAGVNLSGAAEANEHGAIWGVQYENDSLSQLANTDRHYTGGFRISRLSAPGSIPAWLAPLEAIPSIFTDQSEPASRRWSLTVQQTLFTPDRISDTALIVDDRPFAAWLSLGLTVQSVRESPDGSGREDIIGVEFGMVGPSAQGEPIQNAIHDAIGASPANGWGNQLNDEAGLQFYFERKWRSAHIHADHAKRFEIDAIPRMAFSLGNIMTDISVGGTVRFGQNLANDFAPPRIRPGLPGSGGFSRSGILDWYLFAGAEGRFVARNIFLDGNNFSDSHSVKRIPFVAEAQAGLAIIFSDFRLTYTQTFISREFEQQKEWDHFGAITLGVKF